MTDQAQLLTALDQAGYRITAPRRAVTELIAERSGHFTAADLVAARGRGGSGIGRATIFRALDLFEESRRRRAARPADRRARLRRLRAGPSPPRRLLRLRPDRRGRRSRSQTGWPDDRPADRVPDRLATVSTCSACARPAPGRRPTAPDRGEDRRHGSPSPARTRVRLDIRTASRPSDPPPAPDRWSEVALGLAGPGDPGPAPARGVRPPERHGETVRRPIEVVTTTTVFADIVRNVGGDRVDREFDHPGRRRAGGLRAAAGRRPAGSPTPQLDRLERRRPRRLPRPAARARSGRRAAADRSATGSTDPDRGRRGRTRTSGWIRPSCAITICRPSRPS